MPYLRNICIEDLGSSSIGVRRDVEIKDQKNVLFFGVLRYLDTPGIPAGHYLVYGDGFTEKFAGPLKCSDVLEYVNGRPC